MTSTTVTTVPLSALLPDEEANSRRSNRTEGLDELKASLAAHGILQSLRVRPKGKKYLVIAGNRRLAALNALSLDGVIDGDHPVPVIVRKDDAATAREVSVAENVERVPLTPVDEFRAFRQLHDDGAAAEDIAGRFGVPVRRVQQRLRLAALHPDVLAALEEGKIGVEAAQAFTMQPDTERQRKHLAEASYWQLEARAVREAMTDGDLPATSGLAGMIGEDAYVAAGGVVNRDLFGDRSFWTSRDIIEQLVSEKWEERAAAWLEEGWAFVSPASEYKNIWSMNRLYAKRPEPSDEDQAELDQIDARLEDIGEQDDEALDAESAELESRRDAIAGKYEDKAFSAEQKAGSGVVYASDGGNVWFGIVDAAKAEPPADERRPDDAPKAKPAADDPAALTATMATALTVTMTDALRQKVAGEPRMALEILVATMQAKSLRQHAPCHVAIRSSGYVGDDENIPTQGRTFDEALAWAVGQETGVLLDHLAVLVAGQIDVRDTDPDNYDRSGNAALIAHVAPDVLPIFDADAYFAGVKKPVIVAAYKEITGVALKDAKKKDMAEAAAERAKATGWLPMQLRTAAYVGPGSTDAHGEEVGEAA